MWGLDKIAPAWAELGSTWGAIVQSALIVAACALIRLIVLRVVRRRVEDARSRYTWRKGTQYGFTALALALVFAIWFEGTGDVATFLGLLSAGIAVALRDPLANVVGWGYIMWQRPFAVGDRIEVDGVIGDVVDQRFFGFTMLEVGKWAHGEQSTGRVTHVPNALVFNNSLFNYTDPFHYIWDEFAVSVTFESDWRAAREVLLEMTKARAAEIVPKAEAELRAASRRTLIHYHTLSPIVYTRLLESGVELVARYLAPVRARRGERERLTEGFLDAVAGSGGSITLAYPTRRLVGEVGRGAEVKGPSASERADRLKRN